MGSSFKRGARAHRADQGELEWHGVSFQTKNATVVFVEADFSRPMLELLTTSPDSGAW